MRCSCCCPLFTSGANAVNSTGGTCRIGKVLLSRLLWDFRDHVRSRPPCAAPSLLRQNAEGNTAQRWACHLPGAFGEEGRNEARLPEQEELRQHQMAQQVVRLAAEHALLFRERVQLSALGIVPVGGMRMRQGAFAQTVSVRQGLFGKAGTGWKSGEWGGGGVECASVHATVCRFLRRNEVNE